MATTCPGTGATPLVLCTTYYGKDTSGEFLRAWEVHCPSASGGSASSTSAVTLASVPVCRTLCGDNVKKGGEVCDGGGRCTTGASVTNAQEYRDCIASGGKVEDPPKDGCASCFCMDGKGIHLPFDTDTRDIGGYHFDGKVVAAIDPNASAGEGGGGRGGIDTGDKAPLNYINEIGSPNLGSYSFDGKESISIQYPFFSPNGSSTDFSYSIWFKTGSCQRDAARNVKGSYAPWVDIITSLFSFDLFPSLEFLNYNGTCYTNILAPDGIVGMGGKVIANKWHNAIVTFKGGSNTMNLYLDGTLVVSAVKAPNTVQDWTSLAGRSAFTDKYLEGKLDDLLIYPMVLTDAQIADIKSGNKPPDMPEACFASGSSASAGSSSSAPSPFKGCCNIRTGELMVGADANHTPLDWSYFTAGGQSLLRPMSMVTSCLASQSIKTKLGMSIPGSFALEWATPAGDLSMMSGICIATATAASAL